MKTTTHAQLCKEINSMPDTFPAREAEILRFRFGLDGGQPQSIIETGRKFCITRKQLRQLERKAYRKLRHPI